MAEEGRLKQVMLDILKAPVRAVGAGADQLTGMMARSNDRALAEGEKFRQNFRENPIGTFAKDALFGLNAMGVRGAPPPMASPPVLRPGGALPPTGGNFFRPPAPPPMPPEGGVYTPQGHMAQAVGNRTNPVEGMKAYAQEMPYLDPKRVSTTYTSIYPEPGAAAAKLESRPSVTEMSPYPEAAAILRRRQALVDAMSNPENIGPWGMRDAAGQ